MRAGVIASGLHISPLVFRGGDIDYRGGTRFFEPTMQFDVGPPSPTRMVCLAVAASVIEIPLSVTIGGVPAVVGMHGGAGAYGASYFALANVPDGSSVTATIDMPIDQNWCGLAAWTTPDLREFGSQAWIKGGTSASRSGDLTPENSDDIIVATAKTRQQPSVMLGYDAPLSTRALIRYSPTSTMHMNVGDLSSVGSLAGTLVTVRHTSSASTQGHAMAAAVLRKV